MWERYGKEIEITIRNLKNEEKKMQYPLYRDCYILALKNIMQDILLNNKNKNSLCGEDIFKQRKGSNILAFVGGRGVGKTTALTEFLKILKEINDDKCRENLKSWLSQMQMLDEDYSVILNSNPNFIMMPLIDASILESVEDPFLLLLSGMLEQCEEIWNKNSYGNEYEQERERQSLSKKFAEVYRNYHALQAEKRKESEELGESVISLLRGTPSTEKTKRVFGELLSAFFETVAGNKCRTNYIVIGIDDLDLNIEHGFKMLERLHKFISHPNVIILLAIDYEQMMIMTENHFSAEMKYLNLSKTNVENKKSVEHCQRLATDYLDKLIPISQRVYMPNLVKLSSKAEVKLCNEGEKRVEYKAYYLNQIARTMYIYCDGTGKKYHFNEPDTVRMAIFYNTLLQSLNEVNFSDSKMVKGFYQGGDEDDVCNRQKEKMRIYDQNHEWFNSDIKERMLYRKADSDQREFFKLLLERDLERRGHYLIEFKKKRLENQTLKADIDNTEYRYGDLLESIYDWGRKSLKDKPLIHCIIASFTSEMVREYLNYMYGGDKNSIRQSKENLRGFLGQGFMSDWTNEMLPIVIREEKTKIERSGYRRMELGNIEFYFTVDEVKRITKTAEGDIGEKKEANVMAKELATKLQKKKFVMILECIDMLLSNCRMQNASKAHVSYKFEISVDSKNNAALTIKCGFETEKADFDIGGFIGKSIDTRMEYMDSFTKPVIEAFTKKIMGNFKNNGLLNDTMENEFRNTLEKCLKEQSMFFGENLEEETIAFPFFDLDVSYNVLKRVRKTCKEKYSEPVEVNVVVEKIAEIYGSINEELEKQAKFYTIEGLRSYPYQKNFEEYPYIKTMTQLSQESDFKMIIGSILNDGVDLAKPELTGQ